MNFFSSFYPLFFFLSFSGHLLSTWLCLHLYLLCAKQTLYDDKTYARVPLFQQSSPFMFSVGLYLYRLVSVGNRSYTDLNMNWIRCVPSTRFLPIFSFLSVFVHLVHASWLSITVVLAFLSCSSICRYIYIYVWHRASFLCRVWSWFKMALVKF